MAIYHFSAKVFSRGKGQSSIAACAYRTAAKLYDARTGETHDYRKKKGVLASFISLPKGAPKWALNSERLWNEAEKSERRKNSTVAREIEISLPFELNKTEQTDLALKLANEVSQKHSVAVNTAIHIPHKSNDSRNTHAHLLFTTRRLSTEKFTTKTREWDDIVKGKETVKYWRNRWEELVNQALLEAGHNSQVDSRSYKDKKSVIEPTQHMGPIATGLERKGYKTRIGEKNRVITEQNRIRIQRQRISKKYDLQPPALKTNELQHRREPNLKP